MRGLRTPNSAPKTQNTTKRRSRAEPPKSHEISRFVAGESATGYAPPVVKTTPERLDALRCVAALDPLDDAQLGVVLHHATERCLAEGEVLFTEGQPGSTMAIILAGELEITRFGPRGAKVRLGLARQGDLVGELACVDPAPRAATVVARRVSTVLEIDRKALDQMLTTDPRVGSHLVSLVIRRVSRQLRELDAAIGAELGDLPPEMPSPRDPSPQAAATEVSAWRKLVARFTGGTPSGAA